MFDNFIIAFTCFMACIGLLVAFSWFGIGILGEHKTGKKLCESELPINETCEMCFKPKGEG